MGNEAKPVRSGEVVSVDKGPGIPLDLSPEAHAQKLAELQRNQDLFQAAGESAAAGTHDRVVEARDAVQDATDSDVIDHVPTAEELAANPNTEGYDPTKPGAAVERNSEMTRNAPNPHPDGYGPRFTERNEKIPADLARIREDNYRKSQGLPPLGQGADQASASSQKGLFSRIRGLFGR